jgi:SHS2 domain-containing protein
MPEPRGRFEYLDDLTSADVAFRAEGDSLEALFTAAWEATLRVMIWLPGENERPDVSGRTKEGGAPALRRSESEPGTGLRHRVRRRFRLGAPNPELLLHDLLEELLYRKDAEGLLLELGSCRIEQDGGLWRLQAAAAGEAADPARHRLGIDVKAVTWHRFSLTQEQGRWQATVVLDV